MKPILVLDNYDSFTYNLVHLLESLSNEQVLVKRNDLVSPGEWDLYSKVLLSPGPGLPNEAGNMMAFLEEAPGTLPILGVCLGMQALAIHSGGTLFQLPEVQHGIDSTIRIDQTADRLGLYRELPGTLTVGRYHSWMVDPKTLTPCWKVTATDEHGRIMSMTHDVHNWQGVQFHPESVMTPNGKQLILNWLRS